MLNELELIILKDVVDYHKRIHNLNLERQLKSLEVEFRDYTGYGIYVYFKQESQSELTIKLQDKMKILSSPIEIHLDSLKHQISFELNLNDKGKFEFLEIVPNGVDSWDGKYENIRTTGKVFYN
jgi:hypothetical protein